MFTSNDKNLKFLLSFFFFLSYILPFLQTLDWASKILPQIYPILLEDYKSSEDAIRELKRKEEVFVPEVKKAEADIEGRIKEAEDLALKGKNFGSFFFF